MTIEQKVFEYRFSVLIISPEERDHKEIALALSDAANDEKSEVIVSGQTTPQVQPNPLPEDGYRDAMKQASKDYANVWIGDIAKLEADFDVERWNDHEEVFQQGADWCLEWMQAQLHKVQTSPQ